MQSSTPRVRISPFVRIFSTFAERSPRVRGRRRRTSLALTTLVLFILTILSTSGRARAVFAASFDDDAASSAESSAARRPDWNDPWFGALVPQARPAPGEFPSSAAHSQLLALSWLVGCWELETNGLDFQTKIDWAPGGAYLVCRDFVRPFAPSFPTSRTPTPSDSPTPNDSPAFAALRIIGWNPISELFQSTIFCRDGSSGTAIWQEHDGYWSVSTRLLLANGRAATSVDFLRPNADAATGFVWESTSRTIENTTLPNLGPTKARPLSPQIFRQIEPSPLPEPPEAATAE